MQPGDRASLSRKELAEHCNHTIKSRLKHTQTHTHEQLPQAHPQVSTLREQLAAAAAAMQQDDEYLASFDPDKSLYQDGWAMGEMPQNFQHKLRSARNLGCIVRSERWYTDGNSLDPAFLYV